MARIFENCIIAVDSILKLGTRDGAIQFANLGRIYSDYSKDVIVQLVVKFINKKYCNKYAVWVSILIANTIENFADDDYIYFLNLIDEGNLEMFNQIFSFVEDRSFEILLTVNNWKLVVDKVRFSFDDLITSHDLLNDKQLSTLIKNRSNAIVWVLGNILLDVIKTLISSSKYASLDELFRHKMLADDNRIVDEIVFLLKNQVTNDKMLYRILANIKNISIEPINPTKSTKPLFKQAPIETIKSESGDQSWKKSNGEFSIWYGRDNQKIYCPFPKIVPNVAHEMAPKTIIKIPHKMTSELVPNVISKIVPNVEPKMEPKMAPKMSPKIVPKHLICSFEPDHSEGYKKNNQKLGLGGYTTDTDESMCSSDSFSDEIPDLEEMPDLVEMSDLDNLPDLLNEEGIEICNERCEKIPKNSEYQNPIPQHLYRTPLQSTPKAVAQQNVTFNGVLKFSTEDLPNGDLHGDNVPGGNVPGDNSAIGIPNDTMSNILGKNMPRVGSEVGFENIYSMAYKNLQHLEKTIKSKYLLKVCELAKFLTRAEYETFLKNKPSVQDIIKVLKIFSLDQ